MATQEQMNTHLMQQLQAMQTQMAQMVQAQQAPSLQQAQQPAGHGKPRLPVPPSYRGKATESLDDWLGDMQQQITWYSTMSAMEAVQFASMYLQGDARTWREQLTVVPATWAALQAGLRQRFQPITTAEVARGRIYSITQGKGTVNEYVSAFRRQLAHVPDMGEADRLFNFLRGLKDKIAVALRTANVQTIDAAVDLAVRVGSFGEHASASSGASASSSSHAPMDISNVEGLDAETDADGDDGDATVTRKELREYLNAMRDQRANRVATGARGAGREGQPASSRGGFRGRMGPPRIPHLSEDQVREYMDAGKCFGCGSKDHNSRGCPKRRVDDKTGRVSWPQSN